MLRRRKGTSRKRELPPAPEIGKRALLTTIGALAVAYRWSGYVPRSRTDLCTAPPQPRRQPWAARCRVLGGHLAWLVVGVSVLGRSCLLLRWRRPRGNELSGGRWNRAGEKATAWYRFKWKTDWLWWVAGGYCASALIFNVADGLNHFLVPPTLI